MKNSEFHCCFIPNLNYRFMYLIIDDQRLACLRLKEMLIECGLESSQIQCEMSPVKALELLALRIYKLIFLDIEMPGMDGFELWESLREKGFAGHVIFTTAHDEFVLKALRVHAMDYLLKPVDMDELRHALERYQRDSIPQEKDFNRLLDFGLTKRQVEIARRIFDGKTSNEIAEDLFLSRHTVDTHRRNILRQTGCKNTTELFKLL